MEMKTIGKQCNDVIRSQCKDSFFYHVFSLNFATQT